MCGWFVEKLVKRVQLWFKCVWWGVENVFVCFFKVVGECDWCE